MIGGNHSRWSDGRENCEHKCRQCLHDAGHAANQTNNVSSAMKLPVISCEWDGEWDEQKAKCCFVPETCFRPRNISEHSCWPTDVPHVFRKTHTWTCSDACRSSLQIKSSNSALCHQLRLYSFLDRKEIGQELKKTSGKQSSFNCLEIMHKLNQIEWTLGCTEGN